MHALRGVLAMDEGSFDLRTLARASPLAGTRGAYEAASHGNMTSGVVAATLHAVNNQGANRSQRVGRPYAWILRGGGATRNS